MNPLESQLEYPFGDQLPSSGTVMEVAPGLFWLRAGLPFALDHINLWLLRDGPGQAGGQDRDGWTIVDCGISSDATRDAWESVFATALGGLPVLRVIVTHCHPDHVGLADWLCKRWNVRLWMTAGDYGFARMMSAALPGVDGVAAIPHFVRHGLSEASMREKVEGRKSYYPSMVPAMPESYHRIVDNQVFRIGGHDWQVITGFGHSPEHAALYCAGLNLLISGDMVLPRISTNVSVFAVEPESNAVQMYLDSLKKFSHLPADTLVLPSHGRPFRGLHTRIGQLNDHHRDRLAEVVTACAIPQTAADIVPIMFRRPLDTHQMSFALGEALAHLNKLWHDGVLVRETDDAGVIRFRTA
ncbi:MBL fold metallo-hydrolase [Noviherbaspirillum sp. CPCC 100848]|uniref:MBL fold metallo-hydrolase n=1 Tax=Noviherbaspirillum album TaxID=3080276 RepID=A0ABU6J5T2_9BURK|nr:MBL fold metallo-hydrolase [Noviherbaspirillum sp. CPCC 100848]MEC4718999.1 MBL fold metallo-hydrolase [Noviherbaspirillum sp. CPCC 100848]